MCLACHWQIHRQNSASSIAVGVESAASAESTMRPSCCFPIPLAAAWAVETASGPVHEPGQRGDQTILAVAVESVAIVAGRGSAAIVADTVVEPDSSFDSE